VIGCTELLTIRNACMVRKPLILNSVWVVSEVVSEAKKSL